MTRHPRIHLAACCLAVGLAASFTLWASGFAERLGDPPLSIGAAGIGWGLVFALVLWVASVLVAWAWGAVRDPVTEKEARALDFVFGPGDPGAPRHARRRGPLRIGIGVLGLATAVYAAASLTGAWLGTPPWWWQRVERFRTDGPRGRLGHLSTRIQVEGPSWIEWAVLAFGLALVVFAAWPRRGRSPQPSGPVAAPSP